MRRAYRIWKVSVGRGPICCINWSVIPRPKCLMTHCPWVNIQSLTMARIFMVVSQNNFNVSHETKTLFQWRQNQRTYAISYQLVMTPFLLLLLGSICHLLLTFPIITSIGLPGDTIEGWSSLVISSFSFSFFNEWSFFLKEHDLCTWFLHIEVPHSHGMWFLTC